MAPSEKDEPVDSDPLLSSLTDVLSVGYGGEQGFVDYLEDRLEPYPLQYDFEDIPNPEGSGSLFLLDIQNQGMDSVQIQLSYPFRQSKLEHALSWCEDFHWKHGQALEVAWEPGASTIEDLEDWEVLGEARPESNEVDVLDRLAETLGADPEEVRAALGGTWERFCVPESVWDSDGNLIHFWFTDRATRERALGIGGDALYLQPVTWEQDEEGHEIAVLADFPHPIHTGEFHGGFYSSAGPAFPEGDPVEALAAALGTLEAITAIRQSRPSSAT
ncbi:hypothetical protein [Nocardioides sp. SYSU DS0651]|uniref:hypothetical protein n=1 Tax=Nocardioides sp. SYSU DS0651 TaxID=3415955 RepID=UPI003F4B1348